MSLRSWGFTRFQHARDSPTIVGIHRVSARRPQHALQALPAQTLDRYLAVTIKRFRTSSVGYASLTCSSRRVCKSPPALQMHDVSARRRVCAVRFANHEFTDRLEASLRPRAGGRPMAGPVPPRFEIRAARRGSESVGIPDSHRSGDDGEAQTLRGRRSSMARLAAVGVQVKSPWQSPSTP